MPLLFLVVVGIGLWGARGRLGDLQVDQSALVTNADLRAAAWVRQDTPADARFLVNSFFAYGGTVIVGSDAGWWLPLLAGRATTLPPLTYAAEEGPRPDYRVWVNSLTEEIHDKGIADPDTVTQLRARGVNYLYIGQRQGQVNYDGADSLKPSELLNSPFFYPVYHQDRVWVFEITR